MLRLSIGCIVLISLSLATAGAPHAQGRSSGATPTLNPSLAGRDSFESYCAACHGSRGVGDGPVAASLRTRPADLTALARRNDGSYPRERVFGAISGETRPVAAHGSTDMPIWGAIFRAFESDAVARQRIDSLVAYIGSIQAPTTASNDSGSRLFRTHCASCHGADARGTGPMAGLLRRQPPDLTTFTARNGGVFPSERLTQIIDGRFIASHGDREMPVWGDVFRRASDGFELDSPQARIEALVRYLAGIQGRVSE